MDQSENLAIDCLLGHCLFSDEPIRQVFSCRVLADGEEEIHDVLLWNFWACKAAFRIDFTGSTRKCSEWTIHHEV